jgi:Ca2+-binding RTX toxin-like protein
MTVFIDPAGHTFNLDADLDQDEVYLNDGNDNATMTNATSVFAYGGNGEDILSYEGTGIAHLYGGAGGDFLLGGAHNDIISGDDGGDILFGSDGIDVLIGGLDADEFQFLDASESHHFASDRILDFSHAEHDKIQLSGFDTNPGSAQTDHFKFIGTQSFAAFHAKHPGSNAVLLRFDAKHHLLQGDTHHNFKLDGQDFEVKLDGVDHLVKGDLILA